MKAIKVLMFVIFICNSLLFALSNNILADKYLIAAQRYIKAKEYKRAEEEFEKIFNLGVKIPNDLYYFYAKTLKNGNKLNSALNNFNLYIEKTGRNSKHYQEALSYIIEIEDTIVANEKAEKERVRKEQIRIQQKKEKDEEKRKEQINKRRRAPITKCIRASLKAYNNYQESSRLTKKLRKLRKEKQYYANKWASANNSYEEAKYNAKYNKAIKEDNRLSNYVWKADEKWDKSDDYAKKICKDQWEVDDIRAVCKQVDSSKKTRICKNYN